MTVIMMSVMMKQKREEVGKEEEGRGKRSETKEGEKESCQ